MYNHKIHCMLLSISCSPPKVLYHSMHRNKIHVTGSTSNWNCPGRLFLKNVLYNMNIGTWSKQLRPGTRWLFYTQGWFSIQNKTRAMQSVVYLLAIKPLKNSKFNCDVDLWPWKSIGWQIFVSITWVPSLVEIHWTMLTLSVHKKCYRRMDRCTDGQ